MPQSTSINANHAADLAAGRELGSKLENADKNYRQAITDGDRGQIAEAKSKLDKAQENYMSFVSTKDKEHDMIMQIINMIRD